MTRFPHPRDWRPAATAPLVLAVTLMLQPVPALAATDSPNWAPTASERLVKLPTVYLKKSIDRDFQSSGLAAAIRDRTDELGTTQQTILELQDAMDMAEGDVRIELKHQLLAHKQAFVQALGARIDLQRREAETRARLYQNLLDKISADEAAMTPARQELVAAQQLARQRFESAIGDVDMNVFGSVAEMSRYSEKYAENRAAIDALSAKIAAHPMNRMPVFDGEEMDRKTYLQRLAEDSRTTLALLTQEEELLGYMGKLVALDAMALHDEIATAQAEEQGFDPDQAGVELSDAARLFLN